MAAKYHHIREEISGHTVAGTMTEHSNGSWSIEFEIVREGRIVVPLRGDRSRTYLSYSDAAEAIMRQAKESLDKRGLNR